MVRRIWRWCCRIRCYISGGWSWHDLQMYGCLLTKELLKFNAVFKHIIKQYNSSAVAAMIGFECHGLAFNNRWWNTKFFKTLYLCYLIKRGVVPWDAHAEVGTKNQELRLHIIDDQLVDQIVVIKASWQSLKIVFIENERHQLEENWYWLLCWKVVDQLMNLEAVAWLLL